MTDAFMGEFMAAVDRITAPRTSAGPDRAGSFAGYPCQTRTVNGGTQHRFTFVNGWGASVICHDFSYGHEDGLWELAPLHHGKLSEWGTIIDDEQVVGWLTEADVSDWLDKIAAFAPST